MHARWDKGAEFLISQVGKSFSFLLVFIGMKQSRCRLKRKWHFSASPFPTEERVIPACVKCSFLQRAEGTQPPSCLVTPEPGVNQSHPSSLSRARWGVEREPTDLFLTKHWVSLIKSSVPRTWPRPWPSTGYQGVIPTPGLGTVLSLLFRHYPSGHLGPGSARTRGLSARRKRRVCFPPLCFSFKPCAQFPSTHAHPPKVFSHL